MVLSDLDWKDCSMPTCRGLCHRSSRLSQHLLQKGPMKLEQQEQPLLENLLSGDDLQLKKFLIWIFESFLLSFSFAPGPRPRESPQGLLPPSCHWLIN